jgi:3-oxoacyl-[acyl-carrier-protein] synthase II
VRRRVVVTGMGVITPLGDSPARLWTALAEGRSGLHVPEPPGGPPVADLPGFTAETYLGDHNFRPLDRTSRLLASAAGLALQDAGWSPDRLETEEVGLVAGTVFSSAHTVTEFDRRALRDGPCYASPMDFANTVINAAAGQAAIWHRLRGVNATVCAGAASGLQAVAHAADLIRSGRARVLLAGGVEELSFETMFGFGRTRLLCGAGAPRPVPFDRGRNGFALGEGAALVVLEEEEFAAARGARALADVRGHGSQFDCSLGREEARSVAAAAAAMELALADAEVVREDIDGVSASANGSIAADRHEARALTQVFAGNTRLAVTSMKAQLGEALGAAGAFQVVALVEAMRRGVWPGVPGLEEVEEPFLRDKVRAHSRPLSLRTGLVNSLGYDGHCCSVVLTGRQAA